MAQAETITTAIRELMSRKRPLKSTNPVRVAHTELVATLAGNFPHPIFAEADSDDLDGRADHLKRCSRHCTSISPFSSPIRLRRSQVVHSIAVALTIFSRTCRPTRCA